MRDRVLDLLGYAGFALIVAGLAMWASPCAVVGAGIALIAVSYLESRP